MNLQITLFYEKRGMNPMNKFCLQSKFKTLQGLKKKQQIEGLVWFERSGCFDLNDKAFAWKRRSKSGSAKLERTNLCKIEMRLHKLNDLVRFKHS